MISDNRVNKIWFLITGLPKYDLWLQGYQNMISDNRVTKIWFMITGLTKYDLFGNNINLRS